jgi:hypothetical protein
LIDSLANENFLFWNFFLMPTRSLPLLFLLLFWRSFVLAEPIFPNSVVSNDLEFIRTDDKSAFSCISYQGTERAEMPDKRRDALFDDGTFVFQANYKDGTSVGLWAHSDFGTKPTAQRFVEPVAQAIGKLPTVMRSKLDHVVIHKGDEFAFGEADGHFFVLYSDNIRTRIRTHDLEETVFHESVHATLDAKYLRNRSWRNAQRADGAFVTDYAARLPKKEDLAESALFAWTLLVHPGRLPQAIEAQVRQVMPNRLAFFEDLFLKKPIFHRVGSERGC